MMLRLLLTMIFVTFIFSLNCKKTDSEIEDCNAIADYYENGKHYIRRDLVREDGTLDYNKLLAGEKAENNDCYPANHEVK